MSDELVNDPRPLLPQGRWFTVVCGLGAVVLVVLLVLRAQHHGDQRPVAQQTPSPTATPATASSRPPLTAGLFIEGKAPDHTVLYEGSANADVHLLVIRDRSGGSIGHRTAVVVYPRPTAGASASVRERGDRHDAEVEVAVNDRTAVVRGDLPHAELQRIARALRVDGDQPLVGPLPGLTQTFSGTYGGCELLESSYRSEDLGFDKWFGKGTVYTVLTNCGGVEDALLGAGARVGPVVYARPSAVSSVLPGGATLSWGIDPGLTGIVGYRGEPPTPERIDILTSIAKETRTYGAGQWESTHPVRRELNPLDAWLP